MTDEMLKNVLGKNIALFRKNAAMTQAMLAERLNFSDKAVSKWERGESVPDVLTVIQLAEVFGVSLDELLHDQDALPENVSKVEQVMGKAVERTLKRKADKRIIENLCSILVWFVALLIFVLCASLGVHKSWVAFFWAIPIDCIVRLSLRSAWRDFRSNRWLISGIMWGMLLSIYISLFVFAQINMWMLFLLGIPGQTAIILWFRMFRKAATEEQNG